MNEKQEQCKITMEYNKVVSGTLPIDNFISNWNGFHTGDIIISENKDTQELWKVYCDFTISREGFYYCLLWCGVMVLHCMNTFNFRMSDEFYNIGNEIILALKG